MFICLCVSIRNISADFDSQWRPLSWLNFICTVLFFSSGLSGNWIEIAYGTSSGTVRVIVQHPETVGHGPQLFQTFMVHRNPVVKVMLSEKNLVSICSEYNHVRTWNVTRFRGMISTQPGSTPLASFNVVSLEAQDAHPSSSVGSVIGEWYLTIVERVEQNIVICQWRADRLLAEAQGWGKQLICEIVHQYDRRARGFESRSGLNFF